MGLLPLSCRLLRSVGELADEALQPDGNLATLLGRVKEFGIEALALSPVRSLLLLVALLQLEAEPGDLVGDVGSVVRLMLGLDCANLLQPRDGLRGF